MLWAAQLVGESSFMVSVQYGSIDKNEIRCNML